MLDEELQFFIRDQDSLVRQYRGKTLAIKDQKVIGVYPSPLDALIETEKMFPIGTFLIQICEPGPEAYTITISTQGLLVQAA